MSTRRERVFARAGNSCEYCRLPQSSTEMPHELDHIRPRKHHGPTTLANLALACFHCNSYKQANVAGYDPASGELSRLFSPRDDNWDDHFFWTGATLEARTAIGRTTIDVLRINDEVRVGQRELLIELGELNQLQNP